MEKKKVIIENVKDFNLDHIFDCGQSFRWVKTSKGSYLGTAKGKIAEMILEDGPSGKNLIIENATLEDYEKIWRTYLDMDRDYGLIKKVLGEKDNTIKKAIDYGYGIRILNQDLWEIIISFIISQNNHIPRIKGCIENLSLHFGKSIGEYKGKKYYSLPSPEVMAGLTEEDLAPIRLGYRAKYLIATGKQVVEKGLPRTYEDVLGLTGVGPKVANCIGLFGLGFYHSFPIDVWVKRVMNQLYGIPENNMKAMEVLAKEKFGDLGGFAQQYLFYYIRESQSKNLKSNKF